MEEWRIGSCVSLVISAQLRCPSPGGQTPIGEVNRAGLAGSTEPQSFVIQPHLFSRESSIGVSILCLA